MTEIVKVKGTLIDFPDGARTVPPLSLASIEALQDRLGSYTGTIADVSIVIDALFHALKRNYPAITRAEAAEMVDVGNMHDVMMACMSVSGMLKKDDKPGEAPAATL